MVRKAIVAHFNAHPTHGFATGIGGRFAYAKAVQGWAYPRSVFFFVDASPEDTWTERSDDVLIQFSVWATTAGAAEDLASLAYSLFEGQPLVAAGVLPFRLHRDSPVPTMDESDTTTTLWQSGITLAGRVQTTL
jgi:hypothetical protein